MKHAASHFPPKKCPKGILTTQALSISQTRCIINSTPKSPESYPLSSSGIRRNKEFPPCHFGKRKHLMNIIVHTPQRNSRMPQSVFLLCSKEHQGNSGHLIVSLRVKHHYSPNYPLCCQRTMGLW